MKKLLWLFLITALAAAILIGCGKTSKREIPVREAVALEYEPAQPEDGESAAEPEDGTGETSPVSNLGNLINGITNPGWPAEKLPADLPRYTEGTVVNSGGEANEVLVLVKNTNPDALAKYVEELKKKDWILTRGDPSSGLEAVSGSYSVEFQWNSPSLLQVSVRTAKAANWPYADIPPDVLPPKTGTLVGDISINNNGDNMWFFNFTCDGMDEESAAEYFQMLIDDGWSGDTSQVCKEFIWNGKKSSATIDVYEIIETRSGFTCNYQIDDAE